MTNTSTVKTSLSKDTLFSNGSKASLREEDWDLSCTLDMTTKYLQKTNKSLGNTKLYENVFNAFVDDAVQDNIENHIKMNSRNIEVDQIY